MRCLRRAVPERSRSRSVSDRRRATPTQSDNSHADKLLADIRLFVANGQLIADIKGLEAQKGNHIVSG
ncbi:MAG: hypothetical protein RMY33_019620 [Nostoc sp. DedQUE03]